MEVGRPKLCNLVALKDDIIVGGLLFLLPVFLLGVEHTKIATRSVFVPRKQAAVSSLCRLPLGFSV